MHLPPILLPDVTTFGELLTYHGEWDFHLPRDPVTNATPDPVAPRIIARNEIGPFCTVEQNGDARIPQPRRSIAVRATDAVLDAVRPRIVTPDDHLSFSIIGRADGPALVVLQHGYISGSHWLGHIDPATIPPNPLKARLAARAAIIAEIEAATGWVAYSSPSAGHTEVLGISGVEDGVGRYGKKVKRPPVPVPVARIDAAGNVERLGDLAALVAAVRAS